MKGFIAIILFFVLALAGVKTGHLSVASSIAVPGQCAVQDDCFTHSHSVNEGAIIPLERERYLADMEFSDAYISSSCKYFSRAFISFLFYRDYTIY